MRPLFLAALLLAPIPASAADLRILSIDTEGGAAVLMKTPEGQSVLIDTGWAPGQGGAQAASLPSSADRIADAARTLGISRIDYLIMTHYHADHLGGLEALLAKLPVDTFVDHGPNREPMRQGATPQQQANAPETRYPAWVAAWQGHHHLSVRMNDVLEVGSLHIRFVASDGEVLDSPLPGAGAPNPACANVPPPPRTGGDENNRSLGMLMTFGPTRIVNLGDLTWEKEIALSCPTNKLGRADVYFVTGHGMDLSSSPPTAALEPQVAIMQNGPTKGRRCGRDPYRDGLSGIAGLLAQPRHHPLSRIEWRSRHDRQPGRRAGSGPCHCPGREARTAQITVTNTRNGFSRTYRAREAR